MEKRHKERERRRTCSAFQSKALIVIYKYDVTLEPPDEQMKCETCCNRAGGEMGEMFAWQKQASDLSQSLDQQPRSVSPTAAAFSLSQILLISTWDQNIGLFSNQVRTFFTGERGLLTEERRFQITSWGWTKLLGIWEFIIHIREWDGKIQILHIKVGDMRLRTGCRSTHT